MTVLFSLIWWAFALGASWQAWRAWGAGPAIGTFLGLMLMSVLLPFGGLLSAGAAVAIGARAETAQQRQLAIYSH